MSGPSVIVEDVEFEAAGHVLGLRCYRPERPSGLSLVWIHGGAFMFGGLDMPEADQVSRELAARGLIVVSVDYTLAPLDALSELPPPDDADSPPPATTGAGSRPRARYPVASLQILAAYDWTISRVADFGGDPRRVALGGASAGGNLAVSGALRLRDRGTGVPMALVLAYPGLHASVPEPDAELSGMLAALPASLTFPREVMDIFNRNYAEGHLDDPYVYPTGHDVSGLPPTLVVNAEADRLRMSGQGFAAELARAGVDVSVVREPGTPHGYLDRPGAAEAIRTIERFEAWLSLLDAPARSTAPAPNSCCGGSGVGDGREAVQTVEAVAPGVPV
jgi:acetyl esterase